MHTKRAPRNGPEQSAICIEWHRLERQKPVKARSGLAFHTHVLRVRNPDPESRHAWGIIANLYRIQRTTGTMYVWRVDGDNVAKAALSSVRRSTNDGLHGESASDDLAMLECVVQSLI